jgi:hypothetical protein
MNRKLTSWCYVAKINRLIALLIFVAFSACGEKQQLKKVAAPAKVLQTTASQNTIKSKRPCCTSKTPPRFYMSPKAGYRKL